jgi:hypothetical protein
MNLQHEAVDTTINRSTKIQVGDTLTISSQSRVEIHFIDNSRSMLFEGTVVKIDSFLLNSKNIKDSLLAMTLQQGEMMNTVQKIEGDLAKFQIQTPSSIIEAKNSDFKVTVDSTGNTEVLPLTNSVTVKALDNNKQVTKKVVAQAQAVEGYKIKISNTKNTDAPLQITSTKNDVVQEISTNINAAETPKWDATTKEQILGYIEIAQVKMYQAIELINKGQSDNALAVLQEYRQKLLIAYNMLTNTVTIDPVQGNDLNNILTNSIIDLLVTITDNMQEDLAFQKQLLSLIPTLHILEKSTKEKIVLSSMAILTAPPTELNSNGNTSEPAVQETVQPSETTKEMNGKLAFDVNNLVNLVELEQTISTEKQGEIAPLIGQTIDAIVRYINTIPDWKIQQQETKNIVTMIPNTLSFKDILQKIRNRISDRVSFIITAKLQQLR